MDPILDPEPFTSQEATGRDSRTDTKYAAYAGLGVAALVGGTVCPHSALTARQRRAHMQSPPRLRRWCSRRPARWW